MMDRYARVLDGVATRLESRGMRRLALELDAVSNTLSPMEDNGLRGLRNALSATPALREYLEGIASIGVQSRVARVVTHDSVVTHDRVECLHKMINRLPGGRESLEGMPYAELQGVLESGLQGALIEGQKLGNDPESLLSGLDEVNPASMSGVVTTARKILPEVRSRFVSDGHEAANRSLVSYVLSLLLASAGMAHGGTEDVIGAKDIHTVSEAVDKVIGGMTRGLLNAAVSAGAWGRIVHSAPEYMRTAFRDPAVHELALRAMSTHPDAAGRRAWVEGLLDAARGGHDSFGAAVRAYESAVPHVPGAVPLPELILSVAGG